jgi:hypothetical protein
MSEKLQDGIWTFEDYDGCERQRFVQDGCYGSVFRDGKLIDPIRLEHTDWKPLRRIADLDGKPVVPEGVIEKLADDILCAEKRTFSMVLLRADLLPILKQHLSPSREQGAEGSDDDSPAFKRASKQLRDMCNVKRLEMAMTTLLATIDGNTNQHGIVQFSSLADSVGEARTALERAKSSEVDREQGDVADMANATDMANLREGAVTLSNKLADVEAERDRLKCELDAAVEHHGRWINKLCALLPGFQRHSGDLLHNVCCEIDRLQSRIAELEANPPTPTATHRETATGDEWPPWDARHVAGWLRGNKDRLAFLIDGMSLTSELVAVIHDIGNDALLMQLKPVSATPLPEPAERPIVAFEGAFPCWWKDGIVGDYTAWPSCDGVRYMRNDGHASGWMQEWDFECNFTRTPPSPLPPEHERLVGPIAKKLGKTETEVRDAILEAQGA